MPMRSTHSTKHSAHLDAERLKLFTRPVELRLQLLDASLGRFRSHCERGSLLQR